MNSEERSSVGGPGRVSMIRNWLSLAGIIIAVGSLFSFLLLFILDSVAHFANPYIGILTYLVAPGFLIAGLFLAILGVLWQRHRAKAAGRLPRLQIDLSRPRDRRILGVFLVGSTCFLLISAVGSYETYEYTESVQFCGQACHAVMKPELTTYLHGPHARVACAECHIGPGARRCCGCLSHRLVALPAGCYGKRKTKKRRGSAGFKLFVRLRKPVLPSGFVLRGVQLASGMARLVEVNSMA